MKMTILSRNRSRRACSQREPSWRAAAKNLTFYTHLLRVGGNDNLDDILVVSKAYVSFEKCQLHLTGEAR